MTDAPRWVVFGAGGMLGTDLVAALRAAGIHVSALHHHDADITRPSAVRAHIRPGDVVANCAAWTRVDDAETHREAAFALNAEGPRVLAQACVDTGATLVHYSTDYVFGDAEPGTPIAVDAPIHPTCAYGESKAEGEQHVRAVLGDEALIARVAWLYGAHGRNFVRTIRARLDAGADLRVVDDQIGQPTWTRDVADATLALVGAGANGTHHLTNSGHCSWFDFACTIAELTGHDTARITPVPSSEYPTPARRPQWSVLSADRVAPLRGWDRALAVFLGGSSA